MAARAEDPFYLSGNPVVNRRMKRAANVPPFNPDEDRHPLHPEVEMLRGAIHQADAIVFSTPEYAGSLVLAVLGREFRPGR
jgi:NAD(P)H-dependent FMN reductase